MLLTAWENEQALIEKKEKEVSGRAVGTQGGAAPPRLPAPRPRGAAGRAQHAFRLTASLGALGSDLPPEGVCRGPGHPLILPEHLRAGAG